jgi:transcription elongation factor Elf1
MKIKINISRIFNLNYNWIDFECPNCSYQNDAQLVDVKTEKVLFCNNCKIDIQLRDSEASTHVTIDNVNEAFKQLERTLKNFGK